MTRADIAFEAAVRSLPITYDAVEQSFMLIIVMFAIILILVLNANGRANRRYRTNRRYRDDYHYRD